MDLLPLRLNKDVQAAVADTYLEQENGSSESDSRFANLLKWLGVPPAYTTLRVNTMKDNAESVLTNLRNVLMEQCQQRGFESFSIYLHPAVKDCILINNRGPNLNIDMNMKEVIVDLACGMAVLRGADVFMQGIMAAPSHMHKNDVVSVFTDLDGMCRKGYTQAFMGEKMFVGNGIVQISRDELFCSPTFLRGVGIRMSHPIYIAPSLDKILPGYLFAQNLPSMVCSHVLDPQPGEIILDMCAAPGGKTVHVATLMNNKGRIIAIDKNSHKVAKVQENAACWGVTIIESYKYDSRKCVDVNSDLTGGPPYPPGVFDRVLLDSPCSALGQRPSCRNKMKTSQLKANSTYQKKLFSKAVELLRPGGVLVYSTCTFVLEENEVQVAWALETFPSLSLLPQQPHIGGQGLAGSKLTAEDKAKVQRFDPSVLTPDTLTFNRDTIGFFIAKFQKNS